MTDRRSPDLVLLGGVVRTMDPVRTTAEAVAVADGTVTAVGTTAEVAALAGPATTVVDLRGATLLPGLVDVHNHHAAAGAAALHEVALPEGDDPAELAAAVARWAAEHPGDGWVVGGNWAATLQGALATTAALRALDEATGERPVVLRDDSQHNRWVNSAALRRCADAGVDVKVLRDASSGGGTGVVVEPHSGALEGVRSAQTAPLAVEQHAGASAHAVGLLNSFGITAFADASSSDAQMAGVAHLERRGELTAWVVSCMLVNDPLTGADLVGEPLLDRGPGHAGTHHLPTFAKVFLDGVPPTRTAAFLDPYLPDHDPSSEHGPDHRGGTSMDLDTLRGWFAALAARGLGAKVHCTGDAAVRLVLDAVEALRADGVRLPVHVAHGQFVAEEDVPRFGELDVVADLSPALWTPSPLQDSLRGVLGDRVDRMHPNRSLRDAGAVLAVGSDWPVSPTADPWPALAGLVTRADPSGETRGASWPEQALTLDEAVEACTVGGARALGIADRTGSVEVGKQADLVQLDRDPFTVDVADVAGTTAHRTWFAGRLVHESPDVLLQTTAGSARG